MQGETAHFNDDSCDEPNRSFEKVMASFCLGFCAVLPVALPVERGKKKKKKLKVSRVNQNFQQMSQVLF